MNSLDPMLPFGPGRVRALLLPLGPIRTDRFSLFLDSLQKAGVVPLKDVLEDSRPNRNMFSPTDYPEGSIFYDFVTYTPPASHLSLSPYDLYREPLAVIAVADAAELGRSTYNRSYSGSAVTANNLAEKNIRALDQELEDLRDQHQKALVHKVFLFDHNDPTLPIPEGIVPIPEATEEDPSIVPALQQAMNNLSSTLLAEMTTLARSIEGLGFLDSPGQAASVLPHRGRTDVIEDRHHSQFNTPTGRSSAATQSRSASRMSLPPLGTRANGSPQLRRPSTPGSGIQEDESEGAAAATTPERPPMLSRSRTVTPEGFKSPPLERFTLQGFGSGGAGERLRQKGKNRVQIVIGSLYLQAGRWPDAIRELSEGAASCKTSADHVWYGKSLELLMCALFAMGWAELEFTIPNPCIAAMDKPVPEAKPDPSDPDQPRHTRALQTMLPEIYDKILAYYSQMSGEKLPQFPMSEAIIRACKIMSALHYTDGILNKKCFDILVQGKWPEKQLTTSPRFTISPTRQNIVALLFRAFPASSTELLTVVDRAAILSGICFILGKIGFQRKKTMVSRELMSVLITGLVEARTRGAADVGIHPAAGLVSLTGPGSQTKGATLELQEEDVEQGIGNLLDVMCRNYGVIDFDMPKIMGTGVKDAETVEAIVGRLRRQSAARLYGFPGVKLNMLRACINFCEALPDFQGVLKYSSDLLRTAGSGVAPGPRGDDASPMIGREEQSRLLTNISKTYDLARRLGMQDLAGEYWDEFLVRGISLEPLPESKAPVQHAKSIIPGATISRASQDVNPFIYNPFLKKKDEKPSQQTLVAHEPATFKITLQNPYDIEVEIESISVIGEGIKFKSNNEKAVVGSYRTHVVRVTGTPLEGGTLKITGAKVKVLGCRERLFPIFHDRWAPAPEPKIKAIGLGALQYSVDTESSGSPELKPNTLEVKVVDDQPIVTIKSTTLPQAALMILEGERKTFSVTLQNQSTTVPVDFILFSFDDSTQGQLRAALQNRDSTPSEMYEYELILMKKQVLRIKKRPNEERKIPPGSCVTYEFEMFGKPGLTSASIQIDYAHFGGKPEELGPQFYTRRIALPITVTVNGSVEIARCDVVPMMGQMPQPFWEHVRSQRGDREIPGAPAPEEVPESAEHLTADSHCLLSLDMRNLWPSNMQVSLTSKDGLALDEYVLPGNTSRIVIPLKRIYLADPHLAIPALNPNRNRQFVVSAARVEPDFERNVREAFWYREKILEGLTATWRTTSGPQHTGVVELRGIRLTARMIEAVKIDDVGIDIHAEDENGKPPAHGKMIVDTFSRLRVRVTNRSANPIYPMLRIMPTLCHRTTPAAMDSTRKFAWNGTLQRRLPLLAAESHTDVIIPFTALCRGEFEVLASVEEAMLYESAKDREDKEFRRRGRERANTAALIEAAVALGIRERRIWHTRRACTFTAIDADDDE